MSQHEYDIDELIGKHLTGEASDAEMQQVKEWCILSEDNQRYYDHLQTIFEKASRLVDTSLYNSDAAWQKVRAQLHTKKTQPFFILSALRIAAGLLLISVVGFWAYQQFTNSINNLEFVSEATPVAESLPDGTHVVLNKQSVLSVRYNAKKKKGIIKLKGEANFVIKHDASKELIVETDDVFIRDIGTTFNVKAYPENNTIEVSVQEGEVQFYTDNDEGIFIKAGGKGVYDKLSKKFISEQADTNVIAYATRQFVFEESDLQQVVDQLNAIYEKKIRIGDNLKQCRVTVNFNNEDIDTIADILAETLNLRITSTESEITLEGEGCE